MPIPATPEGYARLYRAETAEEPRPIADWLKETQEYRDIVVATG